MPIEGRFEIRNLMIVHLKINSVQESSTALGECAREGCLANATHVASVSPTEYVGFVDLELCRHHLAELEKAEN
jgi:hypothetical protein